MDAILDQKDIAVNISFMYTGEDGLTHQRCVDGTTIGPELPGPETYNGEVSTVVFESYHELEVSVLVCYVPDFTRKNHYAYKWKWSIQGTPWCEFFRIAVDSEQPNFLEQLRLISMIQASIIAMMFFRE